MILHQKAGTNSIPQRWNYLCKAWSSLGPILSSTEKVTYADSTDRALEEKRRKLGAEAVDFCHDLHSPDSVR